MTCAPPAKRHACTRSRDPRLRHLKTQAASVNSVSLSSYRCKLFPAVESFAREGEREKQLAPSVSSLCCRERRKQTDGESCFPASSLLERSRLSDQTGC